MTNRNINSRQTGECGKEQAARHKRYENSMTDSHAVRIKHKKKETYKS